MTVVNAFNGSLANADINTVLTSNLNILNGFDSPQAASFGVENHDSQLQTGEFSEASIGGAPPFEITYHGSGTLSFLAISLGGGLISIQINPLDIGLIQNQATGQNYIVSDSGIGEANLTASASAIGLNLVNADLTTIVNSVNALPLLPNITMNDILNGIQVSMDVDPNAPFDVDDVTVLCFLQGTLIKTPTGESRVEDLRIGDSILTSSGRTVSVKWVGRQAVRFTKDSTPVRIAACALGDGAPHSDLFVSANHGMIIDGLVVNASALINGDTITFADAGDMADSLTYYHIETEGHDVIFANGAAAETFIDYIGRTAFDNYREYVSLYGDAQVIPEMSQLRISSQRQMPHAMRQRFGLLTCTDVTSQQVDQLISKIKAA